MAKTKLIGHRGAAGIAPENTLRAISAALALKVDYIEIDVRLTRDGVPIVLHDASLKRTTGVKKNVSLLTLSEIKALDAGKWFGSAFAGETVPTLEEVLTTLGQKAGLMLEIKHCAQPVNVAVDAIFKVLQHLSSPLPTLLIGSFSLPTIIEVQKKAARMGHDIQTIGIVEKHQMIAPFLKRGVDKIAVWHKILTPGLAAHLQEKSIETWSFTVDDIVLARFLTSIGVSGIISNHPERMQPLIGEIL